MISSLFSRTRCRRSPVSTPGAALIFSFPPSVASFTPSCASVSRTVVTASMGRRRLEDERLRVLDLGVGLEAHVLEQQLLVQGFDEEVGLLGDDLLHRDVGSQIAAQGVAQAV